MIVDITNAESEEDASLLVSGVAMNLMLEEGIELPETIEIAFIGNLSPQQWEKLFNLIQYHIEIPSELLELLPANIQKLPSCKIKEIRTLTITE